MNGISRWVAALAFAAPMLLAPPGVAAQDVPEFTPYTVAPGLLNLDEVAQTLVREYPTALREAGIGGRVNVWFHIDRDGLVQRKLIDVSSGQEALDQAALNVAEVFRFSPALNREERVAVWISLPITFQVQAPQPT